MGNQEELELLKFANYFFDAVVERVKAAGAPDKEYDMPEIRFVGKRTQAEEHEFENLKHKYYEELPKIRFNQSLGRGSAEEFKKNIGFDRLENQLNELIAKTDVNGRGKYYITGDCIYLPNDLSLNNEAYENVARELLQAVRNKTVEEISKYHLKLHPTDLEKRINESDNLYIAPIMNDDINVTPKVIEFFGEMSKIVIKSLGYKNENYKENENAPDCFSIKNIKDTHKNFWKRFDNLIEDYENLISLSKEKVESREQYSKLSEGFVDAIKNDQEFDFIEPERLKEFEERLKEFENNRMYLRVIGSLTDADIKLIFNGASGLRRRLRVPFFIRNGGKSEEIKQSVQDILLHKEYSLPEDFFEKFDKDYAIYMAKIVINENKKELEKKWPHVFLMSGKDVEKRYFKPVMKEIEKMRKSKK